MKVMELYRSLSNGTTSPYKEIPFEEHPMEDGLKYYRLRMTRAYYDWLVAPPEEEDASEWGKVNFGAILQTNKATLNKVAPTPLEFVYDVEITIARTLPKAMLPDFYEAYTGMEDRDVDEYADRVFGERRHNVEHIVGQAFLDRWLVPNTYFQTERKWRDK